MPRGDGFEEEERHPRLLQCQVGQAIRRRNTTCCKRLRPAALSRQHSTYLCVPVGEPVCDQAELPWGPETGSNMNMQLHTYTVGKHCASPNKPWASPKKHCASPKKPWTSPKKHRASPQKPGPHPACLLVRHHDSRLTS
ncbi:hypothetical protein PMIN03_000781 [Paraphaeosphaeria minitans]